MKNNSLFRPNPRLLLMPVETKARELQAKVFFADRAVRRGFEVWLGSAREIFQNFDDFPRGIFMAHHVGPGMRLKLPRAAAAGMGIVAWDEEALVVKNDDFYVDERVPEAHIRFCHRFFTRGEGDRRALVARYPDLADRLFPTGNPRVDILDHRFIALHEEASLRTENKRIAINSRFSHSNPLHTSAARFRESQLKRFKGKPAEGEFKRGYMDYTDRLFEAFVDMVAQLAAALSDYEIVIRPHPSEDEGVWQRMASSHANVKVTKEHTATAWSLASDVTVHNGCTTAVESALLGCNVLAYCPFRSDAFDVRLPNEVSECIESVPTLLARIRELSKPTAQLRAENAWRARAHVGRSIAGMNGNALASDLVLDVLERDTDYPSRRAADIALDGYYRTSDLLRETMLKWRLNKRAAERKEKQDAYFKKKFAGLEKSEIDHILRQVGSVGVQVDETRKDWVRLSLGRAV